MRRDLAYFVIKLLGFHPNALMINHRFCDLVHFYSFRPFSIFSYSIGGVCAIGFVRCELLFGDVSKCSKTEFFHHFLVQKVSSSFFLCFFGRKNYSLQ